MSTGEFGGEEEVGEFGLGVAGPFRIGWHRCQAVGGEEASGGWGEAVHVA